MARSRKNRARRSQSQLGRGGYTPLPSPHSIAPWRPFHGLGRSLPTLPFDTGIRPRPSVSKLSTVRPLMRTVFTDTTSLRRPSRKVLPGVLRRRPSPDLPNAAIARSNPWNTYTDKAWPLLSDKIPLQRATTCARRSIRREVLFALGGRNGAGSRGVPKSKVRCSR